MPLRNCKSAVLEGVRQNPVFDPVQLSGDLLRGLADRICGGHEKALKQRGAILEDSALLRLILDRHGGAGGVMARRQEELRPQGETQIGRLHSSRLVFVADVVERSPQGFPTPMQARVAILG
jgi:hypothetical protein